MNNLDVSRGLSKYRLTGKLVAQCGASIISLSLPPAPYHFFLHLIQILSKRKKGHTIVKFMNHFSSTPRYAFQPVNAGASTCIARNGGVYLY